jgi:hypothetical protein
MEDVPRLLNRLAVELRALGEVEIQDITFHTEITGDAFDLPSFTVYYRRKRKASS